MSVSTYFDPSNSWSARVKSAFKNIIAGMIAAREAEAARLVAQHLAIHDNALGRKKNATRKSVQSSAGMAYRH